MRCLAKVIMTLTSGDFSLHCPFKEGGLGAMARKLGCTAIQMGIVALHYLVS